MSFFRLSTKGELISVHAFMTRSTCLPFCYFWILFKKATNCISREAESAAGQTTTYSSCCYYIGWARKNDYTVFKLELFKKYCDHNFEILQVVRYKCFATSPKITDP